jgi:GNAT superfamily N-acetyltransferase
MINIRTATEYDFKAILDLCLERAKEAEFDLLPEPDEKAILKGIARNFHLAPCFLLEKDGEIIGFAGLTVTTFFWSDEPHLSDYMIFIKPEYRNWDVANLLYSAIIEFANLHGLPLHISYICLDRHDARLRMMKRLGFKHTGHLLSKGVQ